MHRSVLGQVFASCKTCIPHIHVSQGRCKCQALLDDAAVLTCMSYVDLNPIRAGIAENLETSFHTSALRRVSQVTSDTRHAGQLLCCIRSSLSSSTLPLTVADYLEVVDWTARLTRADKRGAIDAAEPTILRKLGLTERQWNTQVLGTETRYWRAIGSAQSLIAKAAAIGQSWLKGIGSAESLMRLRLT